MNIFELDSYKLADAVKFNNRLNPKLWGADEKMLPEVRERLLEIASDFSEFLGVGDLQLKDITVSGSNAAYTYTPHSDIDLHLVVDLPEADKSEVYRELFDAKKYQYNNMHNIKIGGYDVELYVQNANQTHHSQGIYSVLNNAWIDVPKRRQQPVDDISTQSKYEDLQQRIDVAVKSDDFATMDALAGKIREMRQAGLDAHGEFGPENLAFKMLRSQGKIKELHDARNAAKDQTLSLKEKVKQPVTYGFKTELSEVGLTPDGVSPETKMFLSEQDPEPTDEEILQDFIEFCSDELKLQELPTIKLRRDPQWSVVNRTFGRYIDDKNLLEVAWGQRHIMDILRTVAHELTHRRQHEREAVPTDAGETGSEYENEANARAGVLMRDYARLHPEFFEAGQVDESASGYIPTKKQAKDPRFSMALTQDIKPGQLGKEANKLNLKTNRQGVPQVANPNGLFEELRLQLEAFKKGKAPKEPLSQVPGEVEDDLGNQEATGPEFPPQMPAGTTKVDVSDLTDWYRLGMDISDMDDADPKDYNQGPPQTVVVFPSDEMEQGYLKQFKRLGLKTHDMDPDVEGGEDKTGKHQSKKKTEVTEDNEIPAEDVLAYVQSTHDGFDLPDSITAHPHWRKTRVPLNKLNLPNTNGEEHQEDPYDRMQNIDMDQVKDVDRRFIESNPIVVDAEGFVIDGNHRATAAKLGGLFDIPAYVPVEVNENFADGKGPGRPGDSQRHGIPKGATMAELEKASHAKGRKGQLARWQLNMRRGKKK